jgi:UV DNA damage repair endonuclease
MLSFQSIPFSVLSHLSICNQLSASIHPVLSSQLDQVSMFAEQVVRSFGSLMSKSTAHSVLSHRTDLRPNDYPELASDQQSAADALRDALLL